MYTNLYTSMDIEKNPQKIDVADEDWIKNQDFVAYSKRGKKKYLYHTFFL